MDFHGHVRTTGSALKNWLLAQLQDSLAVAALWLVGLLILRVPLALLWALLALPLQFIPHFGPIVTLIGPAIAAVLSGGWERLFYVLGLYAVVAVADGFLFQPLFMKRTARVPVWASVLTPIVLGLLFNIWGVLMAGPLLALIYAYRQRRGASR